MKKILCVDFDGVLHSYTSGWQGASVIKDEPVIGAIEWLLDMLEVGYEVCIYSSRSKEPGGIEAMRHWLHDHSLGIGAAFEGFVDRLQFPTEKPPAWLTIDDRAICFRGTFPSVTEIDNFKPWNK